MRRVRQLWKGSGSWEFQALLVSGWSYREKFWKFDLKKIGGAMNILGARVKRVFPPSWQAFLDGRPGSLLYWSIDPSVSLHCLFHLMQCSLLFFSFVLKAELTWLGGRWRDPGQVRGFQVLGYSLLFPLHVPHPRVEPKEIFFQTEFSG